MPLYTVLHNLLNVLVQIGNKMGLQKKYESGASLRVACQLKCNALSLVVAVLVGEGVQYLAPLACETREGLLA
jgi:hypothetical protein